MIPTILNTQKWWKSAYGVLEKKDNVESRLKYSVGRYDNLNTLSGL